MTLNIFNGKKQQQFIDKLNKCITIIGYDMMPRKNLSFFLLTSVSTHRLFRCGLKNEMKRNPVKTTTATKQITIFDLFDI